MVSGPLNWLRVIDCSTGRLGMAGALLAEWGADVIKLDSTEGTTDAADQIVRATHDRGKRSVLADPATVRGRETLVSLIERADVLIETWATGFAESQQLSHGVLHRINPRLVHATISGWGEGSLERDVPSFEPLIDAWIGTMGEQTKMATFMRGRPDAVTRDGPIYYGWPMSSTGASYLAVIGILGALYRRFDDGLGRHISTSLVDGALSYLSCGWRDADVPPPPSNPGRNFVSYLRCGDGKYLGIHTGAVGAFDRLMAAVGLDDRIPPASGDDASFAMTFTPEDIVALDTQMPKIMSTQSRDAWEQILTEADVCCIPCLQPGEMFDHPQVAANDMAVVVDDPVLGPLTQIGVATRFERTPGSIQRPAPLPGQHTSEVLAEPCDAGPARDIEQLVADARPLLEGVHVLDVGQYYAGPFGARLLGDLGADVIKLEPLRGDPLRGMDPGGPSEAAQFRKRSIALDMKSEEGQRIARRLVAWADVLHHNMRPGVAERLGIGYQDATELNSAIIYDFAPGWGGRGPYVARQGFAPMYSGFVGTAFEVSGEGNPPIAPVGHEDPGNGLLGAAGMLAALLHRRRTGEGQLIEHSQLSATMTHMRHVVRTVDHSVLGTIGLNGQRVGVSPFDRIYRCDDGWVCVVAGSPAERGALCEAAAQWIDEGCPSGDSAATGAGSPELELWLEGAFSGRSVNEIIDGLRAAGVPCETAPLDNCHAVLSNPLNLEARRVFEWRDEKRGCVREVDHLLRITDAALPPGRERPLKGEHTTEILSELGFSDQDIEGFYRDGVVSSCS